jgi:hypothetical protein
LQARAEGRSLKANLPGPGFLKLGLILIGLLVLNEVMFFATSLAFEPNAVVIILLIVLSAFFWRYFKHIADIRGDVSAKGSDNG